MQGISANSELFKETDDTALDKNTYEIRFCELISVSLAFLWYNNGSETAVYMISVLWERLPQCLVFEESLLKPGQAFFM